MTEFEDLAGRSPPRREMHRKAQKPRVDPSKWCPASAPRPERILIHVRCRKAQKSGSSTVAHIFLPLGRGFHWSTELPEAALAPLALSRLPRRAEWDQ